MKEEVDQAAVRLLFLLDYAMLPGYISLPVGSRALSFSGPLLSVSVEFCVCVCVAVQTLEVRSNISETKGARG